ncbi:hypothetical protein Tco_0962219 [Tanacetum coccineum]
MFILSVSLLREALEITPIDQAHQFESPPLGDAIMDFVNAMGYSEETYFVSMMAVNNLYQTWRAILSMINQCEEDGVFGMQIPKELIIDNIRNAPYYNVYLEMVAKHDHKIAANEGGKKKSASKANQSRKPATAKQPKLVSSKQSKHAPAKRLKPVKEKSTNPSPIKKVGKEQAQPKPVPEPKPQGEEVDYDLQRGIQMSLKSIQPPVDGDTKILNIGEEQGEDVANKVDLEEKPTEIDEGQVGPNPGQSHVALAGPDPEPMHDDFVAAVYPQVHESLKHPYEEHVHLENPLSSTGTLSSMKNLDNFTFDDQFIADKSPKDELRNANMETEVESMVTAPIHQALSYVPPLSTPVIDLTPPKPDKIVQGLSSGVFMLELRDLPHKISQTVNEVFKEAVQTALQAPLRKLFRDLSKAKMKEILHQQMFESGSYQSQPEHVALYKALEASMDRDNRDELFKETTKSRKRSRDDQDPPPPPPDSD